MSPTPDPTDRPPGADGRGPVPDGGTDWCDLTAFQRDVLLAIADLGEGRPFGRQVKDRLDREYAEPVNQSRLYQALDALVERGLLTKRHGTIDARTNYYSMTDDASRLLEAHTQRCASAVGYDVGRCGWANP